jgi:hypothetical protein
MKRTNWGQPRSGVPIDQTPFATPQNIGEALSRIDLLTYEVMEIQAQLGDPAKFADDLKSAMDWRKRAVGAMNWKNAEKRMLREWARKRHADVSHILTRDLGISDPNSADELLVAAFTLLKQLHADEVELDPNELGLIHMIGSYLGVVDPLRHNNSTPEKKSGADTRT